MSDQPPGFTAPPISQLAPLFQGYEIESLIATGGMGAVYCAVQKSLDRTVAIKILPREFGSDAAFCESFEAEAKAMARLNHPNLIGVYDFGEADGMLFIVMEYVPGQSLYHSANGIAIDANEAIRLVSGICNGLAHAHENGILHRDIKPSNILLDLHAEPKIGDFGLARPLDRKIQEGEQIFGTPHYTAPEVVKPPHTVNQRADIFSVGVLLHELLTGKLPADDRRPASAIIHCDPRFDAIIRNATNPVPELRYSSAAQITRDLQAIAASAGPRVLRTTPTPASRALTRHNALAPKPVPSPSPARSALAPPGSPQRKPIASPSSSSGGVVLVVITVLVVACLLAYLILSRPADQPVPAPAPSGIPAK
jgi:serine/threonine protein kinase